MSYLGVGRAPLRSDEAFALCWRSPTTGNVAAHAPAPHLLIRLWFTSAVGV
jgi:hypothetical protein